MEQMSFSQKWRKWINGCLDSSFGLVLVNGSPTKEFKIQKGFRHGDPLSSFLFIIAVKALHISLQEAKLKNIFKGVEVGHDKVDISHLQLADDALILGSWSRENAKNLCRVLRCFKLSSGLKVNFLKSKFFGIGVTNVEVQNLASILKLQPSSLPCTYLGLPLGANMNRGVNWRHIIEKFPKKLTSWKAKTLSYGGRLTLIKSVLRALVPDAWECNVNSSKVYHVISMRRIIKEKMVPSLEENIRWNK
ncbi:putative RNA-directed DNA polymerase, eukaryota, reverse transcriptase zinc-binding domain protein [Tanacetum coccineum]